MGCAAPPPRAFSSGSPWGGRDKKNGGLGAAGCSLVVVVAVVLMLLMACWGRGWVTSTSTGPGGTEEYEGILLKIGDRKVVIEGSPPTL